jgi:hypothetical protein
MKQLFYQQILDFNSSAFIGWVITSLIPVDNTFSLTSLITGDVIEIIGTSDFSLSAIF